MKLLEQKRTYDAESLLVSAEEIRRQMSRKLDPRRRALMGQFLTPAPIATLMAEMIECEKPVIRILDPGAGVGSLSAAFVAAMCLRRRRPKVVALAAYEVDQTLVGCLSATLDLCRATAEEAGIRFESRIVVEDFLEVGARTFAGDLFAAGEEDRFDCAILNPPYRKIGTESRERKLLQALGVETSNLYTGFLALTAKLLAPEGEMVAITPRSFCNGPYFEPFRRFFLREMRLRRIHVFDARDGAFADDEVLQENVIFRAVKVRESNSDVIVSSSAGPDQSGLCLRTVRHDDLVDPGDPHAFIHIVPDREEDIVRQKMNALDAGLSELGLEVSTGRVVDFRAKELLRPLPGRNTVPLIYPCHLRGGLVEWPKVDSKKPNAIALNSGSEDLAVPAGHYVLVKRFSAKEEPRRIVAAVYDPEQTRADRVCFENQSILSPPWIPFARDLCEGTSSIPQFDARGFLLPPLQRAHAGQCHGSSLSPLSFVEQIACARPTCRQGLSHAGAVGSACGRGRLSWLSVRRGIALWRRGAWRKRLRS